MVALKCVHCDSKECLHNERYTANPLNNHNPDRVLSDKVMTHSKCMQCEFMIIILQLSKSIHLSTVSNYDFKLPLPGTCVNHLSLISLETIQTFSELLKIQYQLSIKTTT